MRGRLDGHLRATGGVGGLGLKDPISSGSQGYVRNVRTILILGDVLVNSGRDTNLK